MTVRELQTSDVKTVSPDTDLAAVAQLMWDGDCGAVPVVSDDRTVVGMITDRDICIAAATRAKPPADIRASEVIGGILDWARDRPGFEKTVCIIDPDNAPSLALARKLGYREKTRTTYHGEPTVLLER